MLRMELRQEEKRKTKDEVRGCSEGGHAEGELCQTFESCCTSVFIVVLLVRETSSYVVQGTLVIGDQGVI